MHAALVLLQNTFHEWLNDKGPRLGAALAFYAALSLYPLVVITLILVGAFLGKEGAALQLNQTFVNLAGEDSAEVIKIMLSRSDMGAQGFITTVISLLVLLFGASGVFGELHDSLNSIWNVKPNPKANTVMLFITDKLFSIAMVLTIGFLLLVSLILTTVLNIIAEYFTDLLPGLSSVFILMDLVVSFAMTTGLFALIFKLIPNVALQWRDVWPGAAITAVLFNLGKYLIGIYLSHSDIMTSYGVAGSFVAFLVWIYFSAQILYLGAEFTKVSLHNKQRA